MRRFCARKASGQAPVICLSPNYLCRNFCYPPSLPCCLEESGLLEEKHAETVSRHLSLAMSMTYEHTSDTQLLNTLAGDSFSSGPRCLRVQKESWGQLWGQPSKQMEMSRGDTQSLLGICRACRRLLWLASALTQLILLVILMPAALCHSICPRGDFCWQRLSFRKPGGQSFNCLLSLWPWVRLW